jgi:hypothetical protein
MRRRIHRRKKNPDVKKMAVIGIAAFLVYYYFIGKKTSSASTADMSLIQRSILPT